MLILAKKGPFLSFSLTYSYFIQAYLRDITDLVSDHCNKMSHTRVTQNASVINESEKIGVNCVTSVPLQISVFSELVSVVPHLSAGPLFLFQMWGGPQEGSAAAPGRDLGARHWDEGTPLAAAGARGPGLPPGLRCLSPLLPGSCPLWPGPGGPGCP